MASGQGGLDAMIAQAVGPQGSTPAPQPQKPQQTPQARSLPSQQNDPWAAEYSPEDAGQDFSSYLGKVVSGAGNAIKGVAKGAVDLGRMATGDLSAGQDVYQDFVAPQVQQGQQAVDAWKRGSPVEAFGHGLAAALPGVGPAAANIGEKLGSGDVAGGLADATVLGAGYALPHAAAGVKNAAAGFMGVEPDVALWQALPLRVKAQDWIDAGPTVRGDIKSAAGGRPLEDVPSIKNAVGAAKAVNRAVLDMHINPFRQRGVMIQGDPIADSIDSTIPTSLRIEAKTDPLANQRIQQIHQIANSYRVPLTVDEVRNLAIETNGDLNAFYHKTSDAQNAAMAQQGGTAVLEAKASALRDLMKTYFGPDVAEIQRRWGWLDDVDAGLDAAHKKVLNEKPPSQANAALRLGGAPGKVLHGDIEGALYSAGGKTNSLLKRAFDKTEPSGPLPTPQSGMGQGGFPNAAPVNKQLPPATPAIPQSQGAYVSSSGLPPQWQMNQWQGIGAPKRLPPASTRMVPPEGAAGPHPTTGPSGPGFGGRMAPQSGPSYSPSGQSPAPPLDRSGNNLATQMGKQIWQALGGPQ